jgi:hypothetical protein
MAFHHVKAAASGERRRARLRRGCAVYALRWPLGRVVRIGAAMTKAGIQRNPGILKVWGA